VTGTPAEALAKGSPLTSFPSTEFYYDLFEEQADALARAAASLRSAMEDPGSYAAVGPGEDSPLSRIQARLTSSSVAPFDRDEINELAQLIDRATAQVLEVSESVATFQGAVADPSARRVMSVVLEATEVVRQAVYELRTPREVLRLVRTDLPPLKDEGSSICESALSTLFDGTPDPIDALKRMSLYESLQGLITRFDEVGHKLERMAVKTGKSTG
jgi:uncharacterized protein Yka (UPF0111/DUF47 family)